MLSDVTNKPENLRYSNVDECFSKLESGCSVENQPNFENSDIEFSDQDPTYTVPKQKKLKPLQLLHVHLLRILLLIAPIPIKNLAVNSTKSKQI